MIRTLLVAIVVLFVLCMVVIAYHQAYGTMTPYRTGYLGGIADGKADARDWGDACDNTAWSSAELNSCLAGYDVGFKKGCVGMMDYRLDTTQGPPEYPTCADYFNQTQK